jgi:hypothetical protein
MASAAVAVAVKLMKIFSCRFRLLLFPPLNTRLALPLHMLLQLLMDQLFARVNRCS